jgi:uncharacterized protein (TIGR03435 family)
MKESEPDPAAPEGAPASTGSSQVTLTTSAKGSVVSDGQGGQTKMSMGADGKSMRMETSKMSMAQLSEALSRFVDRPVVDMTELKGNFQVALEISMQEMMSAARTAGMAVPNGPAAGGADSSRPAEAAADPSGGTILTSVQALGLKLEPRKAPLDLIVIDRADKMPTEN